MNRRITSAAILAAGVTALGSVMALATPAHAAGSFTLTPASSTTIQMLPTLVNNDALAAMAYGVRLGGVDPGKPVKLVMSTPAPPKGLSIQVVENGSSPRGFETGGVWVTANVPTGATGPATAVVADDPDGTEHYYLAPTTPGSYTLVLYQEGPTGDQDHYDPAEDPNSATIALNVYEMYPPKPGIVPTSDNSDNAEWGFTTTPSQLAPGGRVTSRVELPLLSTVDIRGTVAAGDPRGVLGTALRGTDGSNGVVGVAYALGPVKVTAAPVTYTGLVTGTDGQSHPVFTATSPVLPKIGLLTARAKVPYSNLDTTTDVGEKVTLTVRDPNVLVGTKTYLSGTADPNTRVDFYARTYLNPRTTTLIGSKVSNPDGTFTAGTTLDESTVFIADVNGKQAFVSAGSYAKIVSVNAKALGDGQVRWTVNGAPSMRGYVNVYEPDPDNLDGKNKRIGHVRSNTYGDAVLVTTSKPGRQTFIITFQIPGSGLGGATLTGTVK